MHEYRVLFYLSFLLLSGPATWSQNHPLVAGFAANQYIYNPAEANTEHAFLNIHYRKQWVGFNGAPAMYAATFTSQIDGTRSGMGFRMNALTEGLITSTDFMVTYVYSVPLSVTQSLNFGISGGGVSRATDINKIDINDPALANLPRTEVKGAAAFGCSFKSQGGLTIGVSMPHLLQSPISPELHAPSRAFSPTDEVLVIASYAGKIKGPVRNRQRHRMKRKTLNDRKAPLELYSLYRYSTYLPGQAEAHLKVNLTENVAASAGYRQSLGLIGGLNFELNSISIGYNYEPATRLASAITSSHEMSLRLRIGDKKNKPSRTPALRSLLKTKQAEEHVARFQQVTEDDIHAQAEKPTHHHYVVILSFKDFTSADQFKKKIITQKFNGNVYFEQKSGLYYVYVFDSPHGSIAHKEARNLRTFTKLKTAKVISVKLEN